MKRSQSSEDEVMNPVFVNGFLRLDGKMKVCGISFPFAVLFKLLLHCLLQGVCTFSTFRLIRPLLSLLRDWGRHACNRFYSVGH